MLIEEIKNIKSAKSDLRKFGITIGIVLLILSGLLWWKGKDTYPVFTIISLAFIFSGIAFPSILKPIQKIWMAFAVVLGWFMTRLILSVLFYVVFTAIGVLSRIFGKKFLNLNSDNEMKSYWIYRKTEPFDKNRYEKQF